MLDDKAKTAIQKAMRTLVQWKGDLFSAKSSQIDALHKVLVEAEIISPPSGYGYDYGYGQGYGEGEYGSKTLSDEGKAKALKELTDAFEILGKYAKQLFADESQKLWDEVRTYWTEEVAPDLQPASKEQIQKAVNEVHAALQVISKYKDDLQGYAPELYEAIGTVSQYAVTRLKKELDEYDNSKIW